MINIFYIRKLIYKKFIKNDAFKGEIKIKICINEYETKLNQIIENKLFISK